MKVLRAEAMGFCFGVRDALTATRDVQNPEDVTIHGELVHNETVLVELETRGFRITDETERARLPATEHVMITAHGVSDRERSRLQAAGKRLIDTTCPLVRRVHMAAQVLAREGRHVIVVGKPGHVEVQGIIEDLPGYTVVGRADDVRNYGTPRLGIVCQSTTPPRLAGEMRARIHECNPDADIRWMDTICQPTRDRQTAVLELLQKVDAMVVVGGRNSNNTRALVDLCHEHGVPALHVQEADDLEASWFSDFETVGLTAGTSTPDETIELVYERLSAIGNGWPSGSSAPVRMLAPSGEHKD